MGPWPWLSSIASWRERSSSRLKAGRTVHTAPKKGNVQHRKRTDRYTKGPLPQRGHYPTERNHLAGPPAAAKVDQFFAAADNKHHLLKSWYVFWRDLSVRVSFAIAPPDR